MGRRSKDSPLKLIGSATETHKPGGTRGSLNRSMDRFLGGANGNVVALEIERLRLYITPECAVLGFVNTGQRFSGFRCFGGRVGVIAQPEAGHRLNLSVGAIRSSSQNRPTWATSAWTGAGFAERAPVFEERWVFQNSAAAA